MSLSASLAGACRVSIALALWLAGCATKQASLTFDEINAVVAVLKGFVSEKVAHCVRYEGERPPGALVRRMQRIGPDIAYCRNDRPHLDITDVHRIRRGVYLIHLYESVIVEGYFYSVIVEQDDDGIYRVVHRE